MLMGVCLAKLPNSYVAMDLETTGLNPEVDGIIEIAGVKVVDGIVSETFQTYVDTSARMSAEAASVNGITKDMLKGAPTTEDALLRFLEFSEGFPLIGHNAKKFDRAFVNQACAHSRGASTPTEWYDTMEIYRDLFGRNISLKSLCIEAGVENKKAHSALPDTQATHECYQWLRGEVAKYTTDARDFSTHADSGVLLGEVVCITGENPLVSRHDMMQAICDNGGTPSNGVTKKVTMLVKFGDAVTGKVKKAQEYADVTGIRTIDGNTFCDMVGIPFEADEVPHGQSQVQAQGTEGSKLGCGAWACVFAILGVVFLLVLKFIGGWW